MCALGGGTIGDTMYTVCGEEKDRTRGAAEAEIVWKCHTGV